MIFLWLIFYLLSIYIFLILLFNNKKTLKFYFLKIK